MHKIAIKRQIVQNFYALPPLPTLNRVANSHQAAPHRAFGRCLMQWNFIEAPHRPHSRPCCPRFCTIFGRNHPVNLANLFGQETVREGVLRVIPWRCCRRHALRGAPPARGRYERKGDGLDVSRPVKRPNYGHCNSNPSNSQQMIDLMINPIEAGKIIQTGNI